MESPHFTRPLCFYRADGIFCLDFFANLNRNSIYTTEIVIELCTNDSHTTFDSRLLRNLDPNSEYSSFVQRSITLSGRFCVVLPYMGHVSRFDRRENRGDLLHDAAPLHMERTLSCGVQLDPMGGVTAQLKRRSSDSGDATQMFYIWSLFGMSQVGAATTACLASKSCDPEDTAHEKKSTVLYLV